jgi:carbonic anhydrase
MANVEHGVTTLRQQLSRLEGHHSKEPVVVIGAVYDIQSGAVHFLDNQTLPH